MARLAEPAATRSRTQSSAPRRAARPPTPRCPRRGRSRRAPRPRLGRTDTSMPCPIGSLSGVEHRRRGSPAIASMCGASRGCSAAITTSTLSSHQPSSASARDDVGEQPHRVGVAAAASSVAGNSVPRSGRPAGPSSASATACATASPSEWPASRGASAIVTPAEHERRRVAERDARRSRARPGSSRAAPRAPRRAAPARARGRRRRVSFRLRRSPSTITTVPPRRLDQRGVVGVDAAGAVRGPQHVGAKRLRRLHARPVRRAARSRRHDRRRPASRCRTPAARAPRRRRRPPRPASTAFEQPRATRAAGPRRARRRCRRRRARSARPARTESERVAPPTARRARSPERPTPRRPGARRRRRRTPSRATPTDAVEHASRRRGARTASPRRSACRRPPRRRSPRSAPTVWQSRRRTGARRLAEAIRRGVAAVAIEPGEHAAGPRRSARPTSPAASPRDRRPARSPPFTTTIEPSSRWPTPWPSSLPVASQRDPHEVAGHDRRCELLREAGGGCTSARPAARRCARADRRW